MDDDIIYRGLCHEKKKFEARLLYRRHCNIRDIHGYAIGRLGRKTGYKKRECTAHEHEKNL